MAMTIGRQGNQPYCDINMTPLIDVMLVLLIVLIITVPNRTHSITIDNPSAARAVTIKPRVVELSIDFDGTISWNDVRVSPATLHEFIRRESAASPQPDILISADRFVKYEIVAQTLAELQREGLKKIGFVNSADF